MENGTFKEDFERNRMQCLIGGKWLFLKVARTDSMSKKMMGGDKAVNFDPKDHLVVSNIGDKSVKILTLEGDQALTKKL